MFLVAQHYYGRTRNAAHDARPAYATFEATVPAELAYRRLAALLDCAQKSRAQALTFPGGFAGQPRDWDYRSPGAYEVPIVAAGTPLPLFRAGRDKDAGRSPRPGPQQPGPTT